MKIFAIIIIILFSNYTFAWEYMCVEDDFNPDFEIITKKSADKTSTVTWRNPSDNLTGNGYSGYWVSFNFSNELLCFADYSFKIKIGEEIIEDTVIGSSSDDGFQVFFSIIKKSLFNKCKDSCFMQKLSKVDNFKIRFSDHCGGFVEQIYDVSDLQKGINKFKFPLPEKPSFASDDTIRTCQNPYPN